MAKISTGPQILDWDIYAGDSNRQDFEVVANDPVDLTGASLEVQARTTAPDPEVALIGTATLTDAALGKFTVEWDGEAARALLAGQLEWKGTWDIQVALPGDSLPRTLLRGVFTVIHDVTRGEGVPG